MGQAQTRIWSVDMLRDAQAQAEYRSKYPIVATRNIAYTISPELVIYILNEHQIVTDARLIEEIRFAVNRQENLYAEWLYQNRVFDRRHEKLWIRSYKQDKRIVSREQVLLLPRRHLCQKLFPQWFAHLFDIFVRTICY